MFKIVYDEMLPTTPHSFQTHFKINRQFIENYAQL